MQRTKVKVRCDMHRADMETDFVFSYEAKSVNSDYKEHYTFCSFFCMLSWLIDDDQVLRLYGKRAELPREIKHPHGISKLLQKVEGKEQDEYFLVDYDDRTEKEKIEHIDFNTIDSYEEAKKYFTEEELDAIPSEDD